MQSSRREPWRVRVRERERERDRERKRGKEIENEEIQGRGLHCEKRKSYAERKDDKQTNKLIQRKHTKSHDTVRKYKHRNRLSPQHTNY